MNTEKEITITELRAKFTKDFDTFGKMDPFAEFTVGKCVARTETAEGAGKEPQWKNPVVLTYFDETVVTVRCYDEDASENEYIGAGKIEVKGLRFPGGAIEVTILTDSGENIGTVSGKYTIRNLAATPLILLKNIKCTFVKELTLVTKSKPYLQAASEEGQVCTDPKEEVQDLSVSWTETLRLRVKEGSKVTLSLLDKNSNGAPIFRYDCNARELRLQSGSRRFNVFGSDFLYLGTLDFDFETVNLVSKEESVKNAEKEKKGEAELTAITVERVNTELNNAGKDLYYHFVVGTNRIDTTVIKSVPAKSSTDVKKVLYADARENKLTVLIWESNLLRDKVVASAALPLEGLSSGDKKVTLTDAEGKDSGTITLTLALKQVPAKIVTLEALSVELTVGADLIGESEPYVVGKLGGASNRTETGDKNNYAFKRGIELKCGDEEVLELELWEEDVTNDELLHAERIKLADLKGNKGDYSFKMVKKGEASPFGRLFFKYDIKTNAPPEPPKKVDKKPVEEPKPAPKVEEPKPAPKVEEPKPAPKVQEPKVEPKVEAKPVEEPKKEEKKQVAPEPARKQSEVKPKIEEVKQQVPPPAQVKTLEPIEISALHSQRRKTEENGIDASQAPRSLNKSQHKESMLPSIVSSHLNYGDRIYDRQSAATLQKSIVAYTMPKANRFSNEPKYSGEPTYCLDSCFKSGSMKGAGFGFGRKKQFPDWVERNMKEIPPPGAYFDSNADLRSKGPTFGIAHKYYEKVMIPKEKTAPKNTTRKLSPIREHK